MVTNTGTTDFETVIGQALEALASYCSKVFRGKLAPDLTNMSRALDHIYTPVPRFWHEFSLEMITSVLEEACPAWARKLDKRGEIGSMSFLQQVGFMLTLRAFDERNAEKLLALPPHQRPTDVNNVLKWLRALTIEAISAKPNAPFAEIDLLLLENDGTGRAKGALDLARHLEAAQNGKAD